MLAISRFSQKEHKKVVPNVLPCTIKHNGPVRTEERYWSPTKQEDGTRIAYFRGRKLQGRKVALPDGYTGAVLQKTENLVVEKSNEQAAPTIHADEEDDEMMEVAVRVQQVETKAMDQLSEFEEMMIWGHEAVPEDEDVYVKGMQEWTGFADAMHSYDTTTAKDPA